MLFLEMTSILLTKAQRLRFFLSKIMIWFFLREETLR